jgi:lipooligosaccharide transport system permease protein
MNVSTVTTPLRPAARWIPAFEYWLLAFRRTWRASVFSGFVAPLLYLGSIGFGLGSLVGNGADGVPYQEFVAPGVMAAGAMQAAFGLGSYAVLGAMIWGRQYHAQVASPMTATDVFLGHLAFVAFRIVISTLSFLLVGALLGAFRSGWVLLAVPVAVLCGLAYAPAVMGFAVAQQNDYGLSLLFRFALIPMFLFAGTFFPLDQLPAGLRVLAWSTPVWHATAACRDLSLGTTDPLVALGHVAYLGLWTALGVRYAIGRYRRELAA